VGQVGVAGAAGRRDFAELHVGVRVIQVCSVEVFVGDVGQVPLASSDQLWLACHHHFVDCHGQPPHRGHRRLAQVEEVVPLGGCDQAGQELERLDQAVRDLLVVAGLREGLGGAGGLHGSVRPCFPREPVTIHEGFVLSALVLPARLVGAEPRRHGGVLSHLLDHPLHRHGSRGARREAEGPLPRKLRVDDAGRVGLDGDDADPFEGDGVGDDLGEFVGHALISSLARASRAVRQQRLPS
jgi:hypothetical protein